MLHQRQMMQQIRPELVTCRVPKKSRQICYFFSCVREFLRLFIIAHLKSMFQVAQKTVCGLQHVCNISRDLPQFDENRDGFDRSPRTKRNFSATPNQLLGLRKKFNFTNAAAPGLDVMTFDGNFPAALMGMYLAALLNGCLRSRQSPNSCAKRTA